MDDHDKRRGFRVISRSVWRLIFCVQAFSLVYLHDTFSVCGVSWVALAVYNVFFALVVGFWFIHFALNLYIYANTMLK